MESGAIANSFIEGR